MLPSSAASRPWSANSSSAFNEALAAVRRVAEAPALLAVRESLPWSLIGLAAGFAVFFALTRTIATAELPAFGVMSFALAAILADRLARRLHLERPLLVVTTLLVFLSALPRPAAGTSAVAYFARVGGSGLFCAMIAALGVAGACVAAGALFGTRPGVQRAGAAVALVIAAAFFFADVSLADALARALAPLGRLGDTYTALLLIVVLETLLWLVGIHGPATLAAIVTPMYLSLQMQNTAAFGAHRPLPHIVVVSLFLFVFPGGAGATLPLAALLALSRIDRLRKVGRVTIVPAIFNINEPLVFGLPIVFNPILAFPFVIVPAVLATVTYGAVAHGWVARPWQYIPSSIPTFASTYLATLDWRAAVLVAVNLAIATAIWIPFVRAYERHEARTAA